MTNTFRPWQLLSAIIAGMLTEQQQQYGASVLWYDVKP